LILRIVTKTVGRSARIWTSYKEDEKVLIRESYDFMKDTVKLVEEVKEELAWPFKLDAVKEELAWPFKLDAKGEPNEALNDMEKDYIKSMTSIPGSARRHEGFYIRAWKIPDVLERLRLESDSHYAYHEDS